MRLFGPTPIKCLLPVLLLAVAAIKAELFGFEQQQLGRQKRGLSKMLVDGLLLPAIFGGTAFLIKKTADEMMRKGEKGDKDMNAQFYDDDIHGVHLAKTLSKKDGTNSVEGARNQLNDRYLLGGQIMHRTQSDTKTVKAQRESVHQTKQQNRVDPKAAGNDRWLVEGLAKIYQDARKRLVQTKDEGLTEAKWQIIKDAHFQAVKLKAEAEQRQKEANERNEMSRKRGRDMLRASNRELLQPTDWVKLVEASLERDYNVKVRINEKTGEIERIYDLENGRIDNETPEPKDVPFK